MRRINDKDYAPFNLDNPQHRSYLRQKAWVKNYRGEERLITGIMKYALFAGEPIEPEILLRDWTFLNEEPCGIENTKPLS